MKLKETMRKIWRLLPLILVLAAILLVIALGIRGWLRRGFWNTIQYMFTGLKTSVAKGWPFLTVLIVVCVILFALWKYTKYPKLVISWVMDTIGENPSMRRQRNQWRFILPALFILPFFFYVLLAGVKKTVSPVLDFNLIIIAPTLGALVLTAATGKRMSRKKYNMLVSVSQKLIVATVLLILCTSLIFSVDLSGGIDANSFDWSPIGIFRGACFWVGALFFYAGGCLFLLGIFDLMFALKSMSRRR